MSRCVLVVGTVRLPPVHLERARPHMACMVAASRAEEGCLHYSYAEDVLEPGLIHVREMWRDRASLDRHFDTAHIRIWREAWPELGIGERALTLYEVEEGQPV